MRNIKYIVIHCSAGFGDIDAVKRYWKDVLKWSQVGYHYFITQDGTVHELAAIDVVTNGVKNFNSNSVHICYQGGVNKDDYKVAMDTRTDEQKQAIIATINHVLTTLGKYQTLDGIAIMGHRDFSPDKNGNGVIDTWERIKSCPSFDAVPEYKNLLHKK